MHLCQFFGSRCILGRGYCWGCLFQYVAKTQFVIHQKLSKRLSHAVGSQSLYRYSTLRTKRKHFLKIALTHETEETIADDLSHSHPISKMMADDLSTQINDIISSLSPECQEVFILSRFEEKTYPEIAQHLGISINTVKYHMKQALKRLRQLDT